MTATASGETFADLDAIAAKVDSVAGRARSVAERDLAVAEEVEDNGNTLSEMQSRVEQLTDATAELQEELESFETRDTPPTGATTARGEAGAVATDGGAR